MSRTLSKEDTTVAGEPMETLDPTAELLLQEMVESEHFSGVVMVARRGRILHRYAYGCSSEDRRNRIDGRFHVGSVAKQFTAAAMMQLVEQRKVRLDGRINDFLPAHYQSDIWNGVTVEHLLSHTGGIADYAVHRDYYAIVDGWAFGSTMHGMIREAMLRPLDFEPGAEFRYCNIGYSLLGEIIETQTGVRFSEYVKEMLLEPLGMMDSQIHDERYHSSPNDAAGLRWDQELGRHVRDDVMSLPVTPADGGLVTTVDDFARWVAAYRDMAHPHLSKQSFERMLAQSAPTDTYRWPQRSMRGKGFYGLGLMRSGDLIMHEGSIVGFRSFFIYSRNDDLLITVFSNNTFNDVFRIALGLFDLYAKPAD